MSFSIHTLIVTVSVASVCAALAIAAVAIQRHREILIWSGALFAHAIAYALFAMRGQISDFLSIVIANTAMAAAFSLFGEGILSFQRRQPQRLLLWLPVAAVALLFFFLIDDLSARIIISGIVFSAQSLYIAFVLIQKRQDTAGRGQYILLTGFVVIAVLLLMRTVIAISGDASSLAITSNNFSQAVTFLASVSCLILLVIGLILMTQERAEVALERHLEQLESLVSSRTQALAIAKNAAETANRAKSTFLANMSHELHTPMNAIMGMTALIQRKIEDPDLKNKLKRIEEASNKLLALINDILDISKIEAEKMLLDEIDFRLADIMERVNNLLDPMALEKGLKLHLQISPELTMRPLCGDPLHIGQIVLNLGSNAIKFTRKGEVSIQVDLNDDGPKHVWLAITVTDTGIGITPKEQERIFSPFEQADNSSTRQYSGSGLGLAISRRLAQMMGGDISLESEEGKGSTFFFTARLRKGSTWESTAEASGDAETDFPNHRSDTIPPHSN